MPRCARVDNPCKIRYTNNNVETREPCLGGVADPRHGIQTRYGLFKMAPFGATQATWRNVRYRADLAKTTRLPSQLLSVATPKVWVSCWMIYCSMLRFSRLELVVQTKRSTLRRHAETRVSRVTRVHMCNARPYQEWRSPSLGSLVGTREQGFQTELDEPHLTLPIPQDVFCSIFLGIRDYRFNILRNPYTTLGCYTCVSSKGFGRFLL